MVLDAMDKPLNGSLKAQKRLKLPKNPLNRR